MKQQFKDELEDKILGISTTGRDDKSSDDTHSPYEATAYAVLDRIVEAGYITECNTLVDFGCGKGRVPIYLSNKTGCRSVGVDMETRFIYIAEDNLRRIESLSDKLCMSEKISFVNSMAEDIEVSAEMDRFYFFNPFSYDIFKGVLSNISDSIYENPREVYLFFYYPSDEYMGRLMTEDQLMFVDEIDCQDLFYSRDYREKVVIFEVV